MRKALRPVLHRMQSFFAPFFQFEMGHQSEIQEKTVAFSTDFPNNVENIVMS